MTNQKPLLSLRSALILLLSLHCGLGAGFLSAWSGAHTGQAILTGVASAAATVAFLHLLISE